MVKIERLLAQTVYARLRFGQQKAKCKHCEICHKLLEHEGSRLKFRFIADFILNLYPETLGFNPCIAIFLIVCIF